MTTGSPSIILQPLDSVEFLSVLRSYSGILCTCKGPKGGVKILVTSGGISIITSSSSRLLSNLILSNPICVMISQVIKSQLSSYGDYGLSCGILSCSIMEQVLSQDKISHTSASELIQYLSSIVTCVLKLDCIKLPLNFNSVKELLPVVQTILTSKPSCGLNDTEYEALSVNIVKAFLKTVGEDDLGEVVVLNGSACEGRSVMFNGVLYQTLDDDKVLRKLEQKFLDESIPVLLFNVMLTNSKANEVRRDVDTVVLENSHKIDVVGDILILLEKAVKLNVGIVACQKVVHHDIKLFLQRNNILLLERMGTELTSAVEKLSGARPISSFEKVSSYDIQSHLGSVKTLRYIKCSEKQFILLEKEGHVATILLSAPSEEAFAELKVVTHQALESLRQLVYQPYVIPGAGCLEACLSVLLQLQIFKCPREVLHSPEQLKSAVGWLQRSLMLVAGFKRSSFLSLSVDSTYFHMWQDKKKCFCGLLSASQVEDYNGRWIDLAEFLGSSMLLPSTELLPEEPKIPVLDSTDGTIFDVYSSKCNAIKLALESCLHMLSIGIIVYKPPV